jgi:hypothetical protein
LVEVVDAEVLSSDLLLHGQRSPSKPRAIVK